MSASAFQKLRAIQDRIEQCEGYRIAKRNSALKLTYHLFLANHRELDGLLLKLRDITYASKIFSGEDPTAGTDFLIELNRLFHNYVASALSVVDHTHIPMKELYKGTAFFSEYRSKENATFKSPIGYFVKNLRDYFLHKGIPPASLLAPMEHEPWSRIVLDKARLLKHKWEPKSLEFLKKASENIDLHDVISSYTDMVENFYIWLSERQAEINARAYRELEELEDQREKLLPDGWKHS